MDWSVFQFDISYLGMVLSRLMAACILGGIVGFEREYTRHTPAGFRTHILVSLGSCLAMLISEFASTIYGDTIDPTRIGAQVVSGIGFLGAGAILRHGVSVKGLTTAASIWAIACVGLACGVGFYSGAVIATILIYAVLIYLKSFSNKIAKRVKSKYLEIESERDILEELQAILAQAGLKIKNIEIMGGLPDKKLKISCNLEQTEADTDYVQLVSTINKIDGVSKVSL